MSKILFGGHEITVHKDYSTSEVFTGQYWIDGKKIYRRVVRGELVTSGGNRVYSFSVASWNIKDFVRVDWTLRQSAGGTNNVPFGPDYQSSTVFNRAYYTDNNTTIQFIYGSAYATGDVLTAIIEYTKTTD